ncbi:hypothetical protein D3C78_1356960 [compost metagenome]
MLGQPGEQAAQVSHHAAVEAKQQLEQAAVRQAFPVQLFRQPSGSEILGDGAVTGNQALGMSCGGREQGGLQRSSGCGGDFGLELIERWMLGVAGV